MPPKTPTSTCIKRMTRERQQLEASMSKEFCVCFKDEDLTNFIAYIIGPEDSLYRHKFIKLKFEIPSNYPLVPPKVTFVQLSGGRIHPNLYVEGKVCLSILGTWPGEPWATAMNVESVLITIRSLLDNKPYLHEPGQKDKPEFNDYVRYATWQCLLLDHLQYETNPKAKAFMTQYLSDHGSQMLADLQQQSRDHGQQRALRCAYNRHTVIVDYPSLIQKMQTYLPNLKADPNSVPIPNPGAATEVVNMAQGPQPATAKGPQYNKAYGHLSSATTWAYNMLPSFAAKPQSYSMQPPAQPQPLSMTSLPYPSLIQPQPLTPIPQPENSRKRKMPITEGGGKAPTIDLEQAEHPKKRKSEVIDLT